MEVWRAVSGYEGLYEVSNQGRVRSLDRVVIDKGRPSHRKGKLLSLIPDKRGYTQVNLYQLGRGILRRVHQLVAEAFVAKPSPESNVVNHLDGCKDNNYFGNLEWCTQQENITHSCQTGLYTPTPEGDKNWSFLGPVEVVDTSGKVINILSGAKDMVRNGFLPPSVYRTINGEQKTHRGLIFRRVAA